MRKRSFYGIHHSKGIQCGIKATCFNRGNKRVKTDVGNVSFLSSHNNLFSLLDNNNATATRMKLKKHFPSRKKGR